MAPHQGTALMYTESAPLIDSVPSAKMMRGGEDDHLVHFADKMDALGPDPSVDTSFPGCISASPLGFLGSLACLPLCVLSGGGVFTLSEKQHAAIMVFGKYVGSVQTPGIHCLPWCCTEHRKINVATRTMSMRDLKVVDSSGNPVHVRAIITFEPTSAKKARVDVVNPWPWTSLNSGGHAYMELQAEAVLKQVCSRFPYQAPPGQPSLQTEGPRIGAELRGALQQRLNIAGARILSFDLVDLAYAPETAQAMLVRQQAAAVVDARKTIVEAAVDMTTDAVAALEKNLGGEPLSDNLRERLCTNLMTVVCSSNSVTPTVGVDATS